MRFDYTLNVRTYQINDWKNILWLLTYIRYSIMFFHNFSRLKEIFYVLNFLLIIHRSSIPSLNIVWRKEEGWIIVHFVLACLCLYKKKLSAIRDYCIILFCKSSVCLRMLNMMNEWSVQVHNRECTLRG